MQARDIMTKDVISVSPDASVKEIARLMIERHVSGLPVIDGVGRLVGIVSDGDLYRRIELGTEARRHSWLELLGFDSMRPDDYVHAHGLKARDVMTSEVMAVTPRTSLRQIADLFETRRLRRVPVVVGDKVVGLVSRANLVQALASQPDVAAGSRLDDLRIRDLVLAEFKRIPWGTTVEGNVIVEDGVVHLWGFVDSESELAAMRVAAEAVPGVTAIEDHTIRFLGDAGPRLRNPAHVTVIGPENDADLGA